MTHCTLILLTALTLLLSTVGCSVSRGNALVGQRLRLDPDRPASKEWNLRLLRVDPDGTVVYRDCEETLSVAPGNRQTRGPLVVASNVEGQSAVFMSVSCRKFTDYRLGTFVHRAYER